MHQKSSFKKVAYVLLRSALIQQQQWILIPLPTLGNQTYSFAVLLMCFY